MERKTEMQKTNHAIVDTRIMLNIVKILTWTLIGILGDTVN
jgi:hypothetical protein